MDSENGKGKGKVKAKEKKKRGKKQSSSSASSSEESGETSSGGKRFLVPPYSASCMSWMKLPHNLIQ